MNISFLVTENALRNTLAVHAPDVVCQKTLIYDADDEEDGTRYAALPIAIRITLSIAGMAEPLEVRPYSLAAEREEFIKWLNEHYEKRVPLDHPILAKYLDQARKLHAELCSEANRLSKPVPVDPKPTVQDLIAHYVLSIREFDLDGVCTKFTLRSMLASYQQYELTVNVPTAEDAVRAFDVYVKSQENGRVRGTDADSQAT